MLASRNEGTFPIQNSWYAQFGSPPKENPNPREQFRIDGGIQYEVSLVEFSSCSTLHQLEMALAGPLGRTV